MMGLLSSPWAYRLWQWPVADKKISPLFEHNDLRSVRRVLDVGCGPGTNARHFTSCDYVGLDINQSYIDFAKRRFKGTFFATDITAPEALPSGRFDLILINSLLHHLDDKAALQLLQRARTLLANEGRVHIFDLLLPETPSVARFLALRDRGNFPRPLEVWREMFHGIFEPILFKPYPLGFFGISFWDMVYFTGKAGSLRSQRSP